MRAKCGFMILDLSGNIIDDFVAFSNIVFESRWITRQFDEPSVINAKALIEF